MRSIVVSDLHCGDPYGCDLVRYDWAREPLLDLMEGADRLILLGDTWELSFQNLTVALQASRPFFDAVDRRCPGITVLILPGNHDHHLVVQGADERRERRALQLPDRDEFLVGPAERILKRLCPSVRVRSAYPFFTDEAGICYHHGHYLSGHLTDSLGWQTMDRLQWWIWRQPRRQDNLTAADYESLIAPLHELCYQVAQLPDGVRAQKELERTLSRLASIAGLPSKLTRRAGSTFRSLMRREEGNLAPTASELHVAANRMLDAIGRVAENLRLHEAADQLVFGHTHTPLLDGRHDRWPHWRFHNSGSFFYDYRVSGMPDYWQRYWPGSALEIVDDHVSLHKLIDEARLKDFRPSQPDS